MEKQFSYQFDAAADGTWSRVVVIPDALKNLSVRLKAEKDGELPLGYFFLQDSKGHIRLQKMTWGGEINLCIGEKPENTSLGCVPGPVEKGCWRCLFYSLGTGEDRFRIFLGEDEPGETECIREECWCSGHGEELLELDAFDWNRECGEKPGWYKGDFHTHTRLSDGRETVENAMEKAKETELDFYVPTEHNILHTGWSTAKGPMILPGMEVTTEGGHCNLFGLDCLPRQLPGLLEHIEGAGAGEQMVRLLLEAKERGWAVSINHPFLHIWKWEHGILPLACVDFMEIVNDPTYEYAVESNDRAIRFLDFLWKDGHRIYGVGGSDSHNLKEEWYPGADGPSIPGDPGTYVRLDKMTPAMLLREIRKGHMYISRFCSLEVSIRAGEREYLPGDEVLAGVDIKYHCRIHGLSAEPSVWLYKNGTGRRLAVAKGTDGAYEAAADLTFTPGEWSFARLEVRDFQGFFLAWTNPIYAGRKRHRCLTWKEAVEDFDRTK